MVMKVVDEWGFGSIVGIGHDDGVLKGGRAMGTYFTDVEGRVGSFLIAQRSAPRREETMSACDLE